MQNSKQQKTQQKQQIISYPKFQLNNKDDVCYYIKNLKHMPQKIYLSSANFSIFSEISKQIPNSQQMINFFIDRTVIICLRKFTKKIEVIDEEMDNLQILLQVLLNCYGQNFEIFEFLFSGFLISMNDKNLDKLFYGLENCRNLKDLKIGIGLSDLVEEEKKGKFQFSMRQRVAINEIVNKDITGQCFTGAKKFLQKIDNLESFHIELYQWQIKGQAFQLLSQALQQLGQSKQLKSFKIYLQNLANFESSCDLVQISMGLEQVIKNSKLLKCFCLSINYIRNQEKTGIQSFMNSLKQIRLCEHLEIFDFSFNGHNRLDQNGQYQINSVVNSLWGLDKLQILRLCLPNVYNRYDDINQEFQKHLYNIIDQNTLKELYINTNINKSDQLQEIIQALVQNNKSIEIFNLWISPYCSSYNSVPKYLESILQNIELLIENNKLQKIYVKIDFGFEDQKNNFKKFSQMEIYNIWRLLCKLELSQKSYVIDIDNYVNRIPILITDEIFLIKNFIDEFGYYKKYQLIKVYYLLQKRFSNLFRREILREIIDICFLEQFEMCYQQPSKKIQDGMNKIKKETFICFQSI